MRVKSFCICNVNLLNHLYLSEGTNKNLDNIAKGKSVQYGKTTTQKN